MLDQPIQESEYFHVHQGPVIPSVVALRAYLRTIPYVIFEHHANSKKNDFADLVERVFGEKELAKKLRACKSREQMVWALDDAFAELRMNAVVQGREIEQKTS